MFFERRPNRTYSIVAKEEIEFLNRHSNFELKFAEREEEGAFAENFLLKAKLETKKLSENFLSQTFFNFESV